MLRQRQGIHTLSQAEESEIEIWDYPLAEAAARILSERIHFSKKIKEIAGEKHEQISGGREKLFVRYRTITGLMTDEILENPDLYLEQMAGFLVVKWKESHQDDYEKGNTSVGPHKDDLNYLLTETD
jgi:DNA replication and repair protein RecF